ncbi:hypothetical protein J4457_07465 [Candidatus Woesearchaeota archaeon]|nr:hypothetical protein [Candidatus Woesearchaeota archaeon]
MTSSRNRPKEGTVFAVLTGLTIMIAGSFFYYVNKIPASSGLIEKQRATQTQPSDLEEMIEAETQYGFDASGRDGRKSVDPKEEAKKKAEWEYYDLQNKLSAVLNPESNLRQMSQIGMIMESSYERLLRLGYHEMGRPWEDVLYETEVFRNCLIEILTYQYLGDKKGYLIRETFEHGYAPLIRRNGAITDMQKHDEYYKRATAIIEFLTEGKPCDPSVVGQQEIANIKEVLGTFEAKYAREEADNLKQSLEIVNGVEERAFKPLDDKK